MASETQSFEMLIPDTTSKKNEKSEIFTKEKLRVLISIMALAAILILGVVLTPIYIQLNHLNKEQIVLTKKLTKIIVDNEEIKTNEQLLLMEKMDSKNSYAHFLKLSGFGYFQVLEDKMSFFDGQAACHKIHGKIIECDERHDNASRKLYDVGYRLGLNRISADPERKNYEYYANYASGFDDPFYIGLINIGANRDKNQWRWSSTGRSLSKNTLGEKNTTKIEKAYLAYFQHNKWEYKLISWAPLANGLKLHGDCAFINNAAEIKDIDCSTKLTIICEEV